MRLIARLGRTRLLVAAGVLLVVVAGVAIGIRYAVARGTYDSAADTWQAATGELATAQATARSALADADETLETAGLVEIALPAAYAPAEPLAALDEAAIELGAVTDDAAAPGAIGRAPDSLATAPFRIGELERAAADLRAEADAFADEQRDVEGLADELTAAAIATQDAGDALSAEVAVAASAFDTAHLQAANQPRIAFREASAGVGGWSAGLPDQLTAYVAAAQALEASQAAELAEKAGPLLDRRLAAEAFARSLAGDTMLDFDWAPIVYGFGANGSYGGYTVWTTADGGYSTIALSNSVAELWGSNPDVSSLVAHEVGHAITSQCYDLYAGSGAPNEEAWATAWAIGSGYTGDGNGESIYGRPSDALIALSTQCR